MANTFATQQPLAASADTYLEKLARVGYAAKGVIYALIGVLAMVAAVGPGGKTTNQAGAINTLASGPFGTVLLVAIGIGLMGYAFWRLCQAAYNPEGKEAIKRIGYVASAIAYGGFGVAALLAATTGERAEQRSQQSAATALSLPGGQLILFIAAAIFFAVGIGQIVNGFGLKFAKILQTERMSADELRIAAWLGRIGLIARGVLFGLIGWFWMHAAMAHRAGEAGGIERGLQVLGKAPGGTLLLGLMAFGLVCYGMFMLVEAKYRRMTPAIPV